MSAMRSASSTTSVVDLGHGQLALADQVDEAARGADDEVDAVVQAP